MKGCRSN